MRMKAIYKFLWYPYFRRQQPPLGIVVISTSLSGARKHTYKYLRAKGFSIERRISLIGDGELYTYAIDGQYPAYEAHKLQQERPGIKEVGFCYRVPEAWVEKIHSGWPKTRSLWEEERREIHRRKKAS